MIAQVFVSLYRFWHGKLHLKGAGFLLTTAARFLEQLQDYPLRLPEGQVVRIDFRDVSAMYWINHLAGDKFEEHGLLVAIKSFLKEGFIVWDVGANSGLLAYQLAKMDDKVEVHFFEPNPRMFKIASDAMVPLVNVYGHEVGISEVDYESTLVVPDGHATMGTLEAQATGRQGSEYKITCKTGDSLVFDEGFRPPNVIKIDTEGHELAVISGLRRTIALHRPVIFFEHISIDQELIWGMLPAGYLMLRVSNDTGDLESNLQFGKCHNSVLIPQ